jgi:hypothetical protein
MCESVDSVFLCVGLCGVCVCVCICVYVYVCLHVCDSLIPVFLRAFYSTQKEIKSQEQHLRSGVYTSGMAVTIMCKNYCNSITKISHTIIALT